MIYILAISDSNIYQCINNIKPQFKLCISRVSWLENKVLSEQRKKIRVEVRFWEWVDASSERRGWRLALALRSGDGGCLWRTEEDVLVGYAWRRRESSSDHQSERQSAVRQSAGWSATSSVYRVSRGRFPTNSRVMLGLSSWQSIEPEH